MCLFVIQNLYSIYMTNKNYLQHYISKKVKYFRAQNKMSQEELSEQAGLGLKYINQLENQNFSILIVLNQPLIRLTIFHSKEST